MLKEPLLCAHSYNGGTPCISIVRTQYYVNTVQYATEVHAQKYSVMAARSLVCWLILDKGGTGWMTLEDECFSVPSTIVMVITQYV